MKCPITPEVDIVVCKCEECEFYTTSCTLKDASKISNTQLKNHLNRLQKIPSTGYSNLDYQIESMNKLTKEYSIYILDEEDDDGGMW
jgi:hypothetical protein